MEDVTACPCGEYHVIEDCDFVDESNLKSIECWNERVIGSGKLVFKRFNDRLDQTKFVESIEEEELFFKIEFKSPMTLHGMVVVGGAGGSGPMYVKVYRNKPHMVISDVENNETICPVEEIQLVEDMRGVHEYFFEPDQYFDTTFLNLYFYGTNDSAEGLKIIFIGLRAVPYDPSAF